MRRRAGIAASGALLAALALAGCGGSPATSYDLSAAHPAAAHRAGAPLRIGEPSAGADLDSDRILVRPTPGTLAVLAGARWADRLPALLKARLAESFDNAGLGRRMAAGAAAASFELDLDIRAFELEAEAREVRIDIAAKLVALGGGRIVATEIFAARAPVASTDAAAVAAALDGLMSQTLSRIVAFAAR